MEVKISSVVTDVDNFQWGYMWTMQDVDNEEQAMLRWGENVLPSIWNLGFPSVMEDGSIQVVAPIRIKYINYTVYKEDENAQD